MDGFLRKHGVRLTGFAIALLALASLLTFHVQDPTLTNLRYPKDGIGNWAGFPGAMIGGSALEGFGLAALLLPLLIANLALTARNRPKWYLYGFHGGVLMLVAAAALGMGTAPPVLALRGPGLVGWSAGQWLRTTLGIWPGAAALAFVGLYSLAQVAYAPQFRRVFVDARTFWRYGLRQAGSRALNGLRLLRPQTGWAWHELLLLPFHLVLLGASALWDYGVRRPIVRPVAALWQGLRERRYSVARVKHATALPPMPQVPPAEPEPRFRPRAVPEINIAVPDAFENWLDTPDPMRSNPRAAAPRPEPPAAAAPASPAPPMPEPAMPRLPPMPTEAPGAQRGGERVARWEEYLRRYKENLDLDWDERAWKRKRLEEIAQDGDEPEGPAATPGTK